MPKVVPRCEQTGRFAPRGGSREPFGSLRSDLVAPRPAAHTAGQQRVLDAFEALIIGEGFSHLTVAEIAAKLHCSRRTLYDIAPTKDDLVVLAVARFVDRLLEAMRDAAAAVADPVDALSALTQLGVDTSAAFSPAFELDAMHNARTRAEVGRFDVGLIATIRGLIDDAIRTGKFREGINPTLAAHACVGALAAIQDPAVLAAASATYSDAVRQHFEIFIAGCLPATPIRRVARSRRTSP